MKFKNIMEGNLIKDNRGVIYEVEYVQGNSNAFRVVRKGILREGAFSSVWGFNGELLAYDEPLEQSAQEMCIVEICTQEKYPELFL